MSKRSYSEMNDCKINKFKNKEFSIAERVSKKRRYIKDTSTYLNLLLNTKINWDEWVSPSNIKNYMIDDPCVDVYKHLLSQSSNVNNDFQNRLFQNGHEHEKSIVEEIRNKIGSENITEITSNNVNTLNSRNIDSARSTYEHMIKGTPVIHSAVLFNFKNKTYGEADFLIRSDWLGTIFCKNPYTEDESCTPATKLELKHQSYHYIIADAKHSTLYLSANSDGILNKDFIPYYKAQLSIYTEALANIQGFEPLKSLIISRKWSREKRNIKYHGIGRLDTPGVIEHSSKDVDHIKNKIIKAINWAREVKQPHVKKWNYTNYPLSRPELYPNMNNKRDGKYNKLKKYLAGNNRELTMLWNVGIREREKAHSLGIYKYDDDNLTAEKLGFKGEKAKSLDNIITVNKENDIIIMSSKPDKNECWKTKDNIEFFVDMETVDGVNANFGSNEYKEDLKMIVMIGCGFRTLKGEWNYKRFIAPRLDYNSEYEICKNFSEYISKLNIDYNSSKIPNIFHWGNADSSLWNKAKERHNYNWRQGEWNWIDLNKTAKSLNFAVKGALGYGLKNISKSLYDNKFIKSTWNCDCVDGMDAMIKIFDAYGDKNWTTSIEEHPLIKQVIKYHETDVKVLPEILDVFRSI